VLTLFDVKSKTLYNVHVVKKKRGSSAPFKGPNPCPILPTTSEGGTVLERFGFIHEKLDIKLLILYVLRQLPSRVRFLQLSDLVLIDDGFDYFEFTQCLSELVDTGNIEKDGDYYTITKMGAEHIDTVSSSIPFSVRNKADYSSAPIIEKMKRDALVGASHKTQADGSCILKLSLSDGMGDILKLSLLTSGEEQARRMEEYFRSDAERFYHKIIRILSPDNEK
jgi:hypothetical protein